MIGYECGKDRFQPFPITGFCVVVPFSPGQDIGTVLEGLKRGKGILPIGLGNLATDEAIRVLFPIEVIQGALEIEGPPAVELQSR